MCYERYHWTHDDVMNLPVEHARYIPIVTAAIAEIEKQQRQQR